MQKCKKKNFGQTHSNQCHPPKKTKTFKKNQLKQKIIKQVNFLTIQTF